MNFEEFKDGFVAVLSSQAGLASSDKEVGLWSQVRGLSGLLYISLHDFVTSGI